MVGVMLATAAGWLCARSRLSPIPWMQRVVSRQSTAHGRIGVRQEDEEIHLNFL